MDDVRRLETTARDPDQRGRELGRRHAAGVRMQAERYAALFERRSLGELDVAGWTRRFAEAIGDLAPEQLAEIHGIAEGAGVDPMAVVAINARTELIAKADPTGVRECSTVVCVPPTGSPFGAQTWDWYADMADGWLRWRLACTHPDGEPGALDVVTEYGMLAKIGRNDRDLGVFLNILHHRADDNDDVGLPVHLLARKLLTDCATVAEAVALARRTPVAASTALTVLDATTATGLELFPGGPGMLEPDDGLIVRTNHFLTSPGRRGCLSRVGYPSTHVRLRQLRSLREHRPAGTADVLTTMTHHDPEGGVCRHPETDIPAAQRSATLATVTIDAEGLAAYAGGPCGGEFAGWLANSPLAE